MWGRNRSPVDQATDALSGTLNDVKAGAKLGAVKGAAAGALGVLGAKAANAAQNASGNGSDIGRKAQKQAHRADVSGKAAAAASLLQTLGAHVGDTARDAQKNVSSNGVNINIDAGDVPRLLRGATLVATGLGTLLAPGSALDVSHRQNVDTGELADQTRKGIDTAADLTQQRIKDIVDLTKDALSSLSDALTSGIETAESRAQKALDDTEKSLTKATDTAASKAKGTVPGQKKGGSLRWLFIGLLAGGAAAFISSPLSGSLGERVNNLRRDLGLGGDEGDDSQYWPSPPQDTAATTTEASGVSGTGAEVKTEQWNSSVDAKVDTDKA